MVTQFTSVTVQAHMLTPFYSARDIFMPTHSSLMSSDSKAGTGMSTFMGGLWFINVQTYTKLYKKSSPSLDRLFPPNLYKGSLFLGGGGHKFFYVGAQDQYYTYTMFDQSSMWVRNVIMGDIKLPGHDAMVTDAKSWLEREESNKDCHDEIRFQVRTVLQLW